NPITNNTFTLTSTSNEEKSVMVFNLLGKKVLDTRFSGTKSEINVAAIHAGIYILRVTEAGKTATKKLVIK
ncbi:MAG: T9SS type A sorting domain-containing protein, partial [Polaribacter sp.]|uniref:T9SS type A sorting domain-containing protein n=1 Tax=Polaribacter sp. TaxID=1920175 RepID=UPI00384A58CF